MIGGIDEVGMGPLAGPVVSAVVVFKEKNPPIEGLRDSKKLSEGRRNYLFNEIVRACVDLGWGCASAQEIDRLGMKEAWILSIHRAMGMLDTWPTKLIADGGTKMLGRYTRLDVYLHGNVQMEAKADDKYWQVSAASILAKVLRDKFMIEVARDYPAYLWERNKGYGVPAHQDAIKDHGLTPLHRKTFCTKVKKKRTRRRSRFD